MSVKIGSARIDEKGGARGGQAGDQTGKELSTQDWYKHSKGWRVFRAKSPVAADKIAQDMQWACDNPHIGYDQDQRGTLYNVAKAVGFNCSLVKENCETDCSALVRVCCAYAGIMIPNFRTPDEPQKLLDSGAFVELVGAKYTDSSDYLRRGDILDTRTQGHTVVVLSNGPKAETWPPVDTPQTHEPPEEPANGDLGFTLTRILKKGCKGEDVRALQKALIRLGYSVGTDGADGDFGKNTDAAVRKFQLAHGLDDDGEVGPKTYAALQLEIKNTKPIVRNVTVTGNSVNVRSAPNTSGRIIGVVHKGDTLAYQGETSDNGWFLVTFKGENAWVSGKYAKLE